MAGWLVDTSPTRKPFMAEHEEFVIAGRRLNGAIGVLNRGRRIFGRASGGKAEVTLETRRRIRRCRASRAADRGARLREVQVRLKGTIAGRSCGLEARINPGGSKQDTKAGGNAGFFVGATAFTNDSKRFPSTWAASFFPLPPEAREGSGGGVYPLEPLQVIAALPPTPTPRASFRSSRPRHRKGGRGGRGSGKIEAMPFARRPR